MRILSLALVLLLSLSTWAKKQQKVKISTPFGNMVAVLYNETPKHRDNFIKVTKSGKYEGMLFHRVIKNFMIQTGDINSRFASPGERLGSGDLGYRVPAELNKKFHHKKGALAAARQADQVNPKRESSSCQFYIVQGKTYTEPMIKSMESRSGVKYSPEQLKDYTTIGGTPFLDNQYTVFGEVIEGLDIIDKIARQKCDRSDRPLVDVKVSVKLID